MESALDLSSKSLLVLNKIEDKSKDPSPVQHKVVANCTNTKEDNETAIFKKSSDRAFSEQLSKDTLDIQNCNIFSKSTNSNEKSPISLQFQGLQETPNEKSKCSPLLPTVQTAPLQRLNISSLPEGDRPFRMYQVNQATLLNGIFPFSPTLPNPAAAIGSATGMFPFGVGTDFGKSDFGLTVPATSPVANLLHKRRGVYSGYKSNGNDISSNEEVFSENFESTMAETKSPSPQQTTQNYNKFKDINIDNNSYDRRRKNNEAAKRSRDTRRMKEEEIALRAALLEQENLKLKAQVAVLKNETTQLHCMLYQL